MRYGINRVSISPGHLNQIKVTCNYIVSWMIRGKLNARQSKLNHQPTNNERRKQKRDVMRGVFVKWFLPMIRTSAYCEAAMACLWNCNFWSRCHPAYDCQRFVSNAQNWPSAAIQKHKNILKKKKSARRWRWAREWPANALYKIQLRATSAFDRHQSPHISHIVDKNGYIISNLYREQAIMSQKPNESRMK